jgi:hypothetical protein
LIRAQFTWRIEKKSTKFIRIDYTLAISIDYGETWYYYLMEIPVLEELIMDQLDLKMSKTVMGFMCEIGSSSYIELY